VYVQGRDDLNLLRGTDFTIRASSPAALTKLSRRSNALPDDS
jgi:hypothetical protein